MMLRIESLLVLLAASATMAGLPDEGRGQPATSAKHPPEADASPGPALEARARKMANGQHCVLPCNSPVRKEFSGAWPRV
jgi:hypothetical protein